VLICFAVGCKNSAIDLPPLQPIDVEPDITSADLSNPAELYEKTYCKLRKEHLIINQNLHSNLLAIKIALNSISKNLNIMKLLSDEPFSSDIQNYIEKYKEIYNDFASNRFSNLTLLNLNQYEKEILSKFHPSKITILSKPMHKIYTAKDKDTKKNIPLTEPTLETLSNNTPFSAIYKLWEKAHDNLANTYVYVSQKGDTKSLYDKLKKILVLMKDRLPNSEQAKFQIYINEYDRIYKITSGFTIQGKNDELNFIKVAISQMYNPNKNDTQK